MEERLIPNKHGPGLILIFILLLLILPSLLSAGSNQNSFNTNKMIAHSKLSIFVSVDDNPVIKSNNSSQKKDKAFVLNMNSYTFDSSSAPYTTDLYNSSLKNNKAQKFNKTIKDVVGFFVRYFQSHDTNDDATSEDNSHYFLKSNCPGKDTRLKEFDINLTVDVGADNGLNSVKAQSYCFSTNFNAIYHSETDDVEIGLTNDHLNNYFGEGIRLELLTNPMERAGGILVSMDL
ncbi:MAG: hypothetical protein GY729_14925 [Desulfobacteraceae bacterium]|nr:hypothetical protein [Desulfobacteraceae bacterium]